MLWYISGCYVWDQNSGLCQQQGNPQSTKRYWKKEGRNHFTWGLQHGLPCKVWAGEPQLRNKSCCWEATKPPRQFQLAAQIHQRLIKQMPPLQKEEGKKPSCVCFWAAISEQSAGVREKLQMGICKHWSRWWRALAKAQCTASSSCRDGQRFPRVDNPLSSKGKLQVCLSAEPYVAFTSLYQTWCAHVHHCQDWNFPVPDSERHFQQLRCAAALPARGVCWDEWCHLSVLLTEQLNSA